MGCYVHLTRGKHPANMLVEGLAENDNCGREEINRPPGMSEASYLVAWLTS